MQFTSPRSDAGTPERRCREGLRVASAATLVSDENGKVRNETIANVSALPPEAIAAIKAALAGKDLVEAGSVVTVTRSVARTDTSPAAAAMAKTLGLPALLGPAAASGTSHWRWSWPAPCPGLETRHHHLVDRHHPRPRPRRRRGVHRRDLRGDWTGAGGPAGHDRKTARQKHLDPKVNPTRIRDVRPVLLLGHPEALRPGRPRLLPGRKKGCEQIEYGLLTDPEGRPVAVRVFPATPPTRPPSPTP
ncbi:hypothetical protein FXW78_50350 [Rhodococcus opacus]|nr:hypothetical protein [Rhodococcus opacus]